MSNQPDPHAPDLRAARALRAEYKEAMREYDYDRHEGYRAVDEDCEYRRQAAADLYTLYVMARNEAMKKFREENDD